MLTMLVGFGKYLEQLFADRYRFSFVADLFSFLERFSTSYSIDQM